MENTQLVAIIKEAKIERAKAQEIYDSLIIFFDKTQEWESLNSSIVIDNPSEVSKMKIARETRLAIRQERLRGIDFMDAKRNEVKSLMENYVKEDKLWLKIKQFFESTCKTFESELESKEKFAERYEAEQKEILKQKRLLQLSEVCDNPNQFQVADMKEDAYNDLYNGLKLQKEAKEQAEKLEKERIEKEKIRIKQLFSLNLNFDGENFTYRDINYHQSKLMELSDEEFKITFESISERKKQIDDEDNIREMNLKQEKERLRIVEEEIQKQKLEIEKVQKEQEEAAKLKEIEIQKLQNAPDKEKLIAWINNLQLLTVELNTKEANAVKNKITELFDSFKNSSLQAINNL